MWHQSTFRNPPPKKRRLRKGSLGKIENCGPGKEVVCNPRASLPSGLSAPYCLFKAVRHPWLQPSRFMHIYQLQIINVQPREEQCSLSFCFSSCTNDSKTSNASIIWSLVTCHFLCAPIKSL